MSEISDELLLANEAYAGAFGRKADLALPPARLEDDLGTASFDGTRWSNPRHEGGCSTGRYLKWHTIDDHSASVVQDIRRIHEHPLVPKAIPIHGYVYDVKTGRLNAVAGATIGGAAR